MSDLDEDDNVTPGQIWEERDLNQYQRVYRQTNKYLVRVKIEKGDLLLK